MLAIETPFALLGNLDEYLDIEHHLQILLDYTRKNEKEITLIGESSHIMVTAKNSNIFFF